MTFRSMPIPNAHYLPSGNVNTGSDLAAIEERRESKSATLDQCKITPQRTWYPTSSWDVAGLQGDQMIAYARTIDSRGPS